MKNKEIEIVKSNLYDDENFELSQVTVGKDTLKKGKCKTDAVCVLAFDLSESNKIKNIYLLKQQSFFNNETVHSCLTEDINENIDDNSYDTFKRCIHKDLAIKNFNNIDSCYYLGKVTHTDPFIKNYYCYGLCLNDYITSPNGFKPDLPTEEVNGKYYSIDKMSFSKATKGEVSDSLTLSACMLLISYIS